jgi:hypothetical protein
MDFCHQRFNIKLSKNLFLFGEYETNRECYLSSQVKLQSVSITSYHNESSQCNIQPKIQLAIAPMIPIAECKPK